MSLTDFAYGPQLNVRFTPSPTGGSHAPAGGLYDIMAGSRGNDGRTADQPPCTSRGPVPGIQRPAEPANDSKRFRPKGNAIVHEAIVHGKEAELRRIFRRTRSERRMCSVLDVIRRLL